MGDYDVGDRPAFRAYVRDIEGDLVAATVVATFTDPLGAVTTPSVTTPSLGVYDTVAPLLDEAGVWWLDWDVSGAVVDHTSEQLTVSDATAPVYFDLHSLKLALIGPDAESNSFRDGLMVGALEAASRMVENTCDGRVFYRSRELEYRVFSAIGRVYHDRRSGSYKLHVDDIATTDGLVVSYGDAYAGTWTAFTTGAVRPADLNVIAKGRPIEALLTRSNWVGDVRIGAYWGYPSIPPEVREATKLQASRLYRRKDSPEGVAGNAEWGAIRVSRVDPDLIGLLTSHMRPGVG